jgi:hypothetical protein
MRLEFVVGEVVWRQFLGMRVAGNLAFGALARWSCWVLAVGSLEMALTRQPSWRLLCEDVLWRIASSWWILGGLNMFRVIPIEEVKVLEEVA